MSSKTKTPAVHILINEHTVACGRGVWRPNGNRLVTVSGDDGATCHECNHEVRNPRGWVARFRASTTA